MSKIKICGLSRMEDISAVNEARPDYIGFVFAKSRRQVSIERAGAFRKELRGDIQAVGVFVNAALEEIRRCAVSDTIDLIQLHGDEDAQYVAQLREMVSCPIIRAVRVKEEADIQKAGKLDCDYLLLDTYHPGQYGGSGSAFNWSLIGQPDKPWFLAGGLTVENIPKAVATGAFALDISSGVETGGKKDKEKIMAAVRQARSVS